MFTKLIPSLAAVLLISAIAPAQSSAASSGALHLSGIVGSSMGLVITPNGSNNTTLNIVSGEAAKNIATVAETSNNHTGYTVSIGSANGGELRLNGNDINHTAAFQISYDGSVYFTPPIVPVLVKTVTSLTTLTTNYSDILVNLPAVPNALQGVYSGVINITIESNV